MKITLRMAVSFLCLTAVPAGAVTIAPSGDATGATDQVAIQAALDAAVAGGDSTIKLVAGTFYINGGVGVTGFDGTLKGAGRDETTVIALGEGDPLNRGSVFLFADGKVTIKNLSIDVPDGSLYLDSNLGLFISDGGAAIDIFGGSATIMNVGITSNGPFGPWGPESLETGVLSHNCNGTFDLKDSHFESVKRSFVFNPELASQCDLNIAGNHFENNRGGVFLMGGAGGFKGGNQGIAIVRDNSFFDNLVNDIFGLVVEYAVDVHNNVIGHPNPSGNSAIEFNFGNGELKITANETDGQYFLPNISLFEQYGASKISGNVVDGASSDGLGAIGVESSDNVEIRQNDLRDNSLIPGWSVPGFATTGAYAIVDSTNVRISKEKLPAASLANCQVLHVPAIDPSNQIDPMLIECVFSLPPP
jgi:hypothetical protein